MDPSAINGWFYLAGASITVGIPSLLTLWLSQRSHRALTKNHHESKKPTVPDRLDIIEKALAVLIEQTDKQEGKHKK